MAGRARTILELRAGPLAADDLRVASALGREALSEPFRWEVEFERRDGEAVALEDVVGQEAQLALRRTDGSERVVHGLVEALALVEVRAGRPRYRAQLAPRLALLARRRGSRVFQDQTVPQVVKAVLDAARVACRLALTGSYPRREYCLQYRETDLDFAERLLEEEGIFYFFEHADGAHTLVLGDAPGAFADVAGDPAIPWRQPDPSGDDGDDEHVSAVARNLRAEVAKATLRDFDFTRPALDLTASASRADDPEDYQYRLGYADPGEERRLATARLEALRRRSQDFEGEGTCLRFLPGACFELTGHPDAAFGRRLALVEVAVEARQEESAGTAEAIAHGCRCRFVARAADDPLRPPQRARRPLIPGAQTATVVGPAGEEIHVDQHGRVKLHFHWDRLGARDEHSSCFVRVAQAWAGPGFGASYVPRIGHEVLVRFQDGDPDRPLVVGSLYNGAHPPPAALPGEKTQSTLRSDSSLGGGGANELRFEDLKDQERVELHAEKDETILVENDKTQRVGHCEALQVEKDRTLEVDGSQELAVAHLDRSHVDGSQSLAVTGNRTTQVAFVRQESVGGNQSAQVGKNRSLVVGVTSAESVLLASALTVGGALAVTVAGAFNEAVGGLRSSQIGAAHVELVGLAREERVGKDSSATTGGEAVVDVTGAVTVQVGKDLEETVNGKTGVEVVEPMAVMAKTIKLQGDSEVQIVVGGNLLLSVKGAGVTFSAKSFSLEGSGDVKLKGSAVKLAGGEGPASASPEVARLDPLENESAFVEVQAKDQDGNPIANQLVRVEFSDGTVKEAKLDGSGKAKVSGPKPGTAKVTLPELDSALWKIG